MSGSVYTHRLLVWQLVAAFITFIGVLMVCKQGTGRKVLRSYEELSGYLSGKSKDMGWYQNTDRKLCKNGAVFHFGKWLNPGSFLALSVVLAGIGFIVGIQWKTVYGILFAGLGYILPEILMRYLNYRDNERMLPEIKLIYNGLEMQLQAGVYVTDALAECYAGVQELRLRQALLDLAGAVTVKADVYEALNRFQQSFDNRYIDAMCITLLQAMESGQAVELLRDIAEQVKDMEVSVMGRKKAALDRSVTFYQLGILAAVLGIVLYACVTQMFVSALSF
ncbi:MAG: hypothetical protein E7292_07605 [Lachnospiraceae bacterium]|nr:hypothetical protein [Lachnospiraceae bacterium]